MNFPTSLLPAVWVWGSYFIYFPLLLFAIWQAPWHHLKNTNDANVFFASSIVLWLIWQLSGGITLGLEFHLLLVTTITLMFGWQFATLNVTLVQLGLTLSGHADWVSFPLNTLCNGIVPIWVTYGVYWLAFLFLPKHFFIYIYVSAFFGGALAMLASRLTGMSILLLSDTYRLTQLGDEPLFIIVMLFPEAFVNGMLITILVVFRPQWVSSFSDKRYIKGK